jgi:hypothetical protein
VAGAGDIIVDGCAECGWATAELRVWPTPAPVQDVAGARDVVNGGPPKVTIQADRRYEQTLEAGHYLVCPIASACAATGADFCSRPTNCATVSVPPEGVVTVNIMITQSPPTVLVFEPGSRTSRPDRLFAVATF